MHYWWKGYSLRPSGIGVVMRWTRVCLYRKKTRKRPSLWFQMEMYQPTISARSTRDIIPWAMTNTPGKPLETRSLYAIAAIIWPDKRIYWRFEGGKWVFGCLIASVPPPKECGGN